MKREWTRSGNDDLSQFSVHGGRKPVTELEIQKSEQSFAVSNTPVKPAGTSAHLEVPTTHY